MGDGGDSVVGGGVALGEDGRAGGGGASREGAAESGEGATVCHGVVDGDGEACDGVDGEDGDGVEGSGVCAGGEVDPREEGGCKQCQQEEAGTGRGLRQIQTVRLIDPPNCVRSLWMV